MLDAIVRRAAETVADRDAGVSAAGTAPVITLFIIGLGQGGAETQLVALSRYLKACRWDTEVVSLLLPGRFLSELERSGIPIWSANIARRGAGLRGLAALPRLLRHLRTRRPHVLCTFMFHANVAGRVLARLAGVPVVVSSIRNEHLGPRWKEWLEAVTERLSDLTVVNSESVAASLAARGVVSQSRCRVIPNAVDLARFPPRDASARASTRRTLGVAPGAFLWVTVGRLETQKDYPGLLRAVSLLRERHPSVRLAVAGDGPLGPWLRALSARMELDDTVAWLGLRDDVPDLLDTGDAFVLSSRWEGSPNVVLEALAAGLPVAATDVGGVRELVEDGRSGFLVQPGDARALVSAMDRMMTRPPEDRRHMGEQGRRSVRHRHEATAVLDQWRRLLSDACRAKQRRGRGRACR